MVRLFDTEESWYDSLVRLLKVAHYSQVWWIARSYTPPLYLGKWRILGMIVFMTRQNLRQLCDITYAK